MAYKYTNRKKIFGVVIATLSVFFVLSAISTSALAYIPLEPSVVGAGGGESVNATNYIKNIYKIAIGIAGVLAVVMLVWGGIEYIGSAASPSLKESGRKRMWAAIGGLILAFFSYIILNTINPKLVDFKLELQKSIIPVSNNNSGSGDNDKKRCLDSCDKLYKIDGQTSAYVCKKTSTYYNEDKCNISRDRCISGCNIK